MKIFRYLKKLISGEDEEESRSPKQSKMSDDLDKLDKFSKKAEKDDQPSKVEAEPVVEEPKKEATASQGITSKTKAPKKEAKKETPKAPKKEAESSKQTKGKSEPQKSKPKKGTNQKTEKIANNRSEKMTLLDEKTNLLTRDDIDPTFKDEIINSGVESLAVCFQCGTCTGACPSGRRTPYRIRQLVRKAAFGLKDEVINDDAIWMCVTCYECQERCPRDVKIVEIVKAVRNVAAHAGNMALAHRKTGSFVIKTGHGVPINQATKDLRKEIGLDEIPPTTHKYPEALDEVQKLVKDTEFDKLVGYNWSTGDVE
ncbi:MAG: CoB--CoM heterodisulfide reductase subunit C [Methanobacteriaceae archaeon]|nr:CoB--CoM heterodisulfide reductase subunit C [Methanobacteriaceae archaeon]